MNIINSKKMGILKAIERLPKSKLLCVCECGNERVVNVGHFNTGKIKSCGCHVKRHGHAGKRSRTYISYHNMIARCHNKENKRYYDYGGSGILVCDKWLASFSAFLSDMGACPDGFTIDRLDNRLGYSKDNCKWVSRKQNQANRANSRIYIIDGKEYCSSNDAGSDLGVSGHTILAWCMGRKVGEKFYPPKEGCSYRSVY